MRWSQIETNWQTFRGALRGRWLRLSETDLDDVGGNRDDLIDRIQGRYGITWDQADAQLVEWQRDLGELPDLR